MQVAYIREEKHFNSQSVNLLLFIAFSRFCNKQLLQMIRIKFTLSYIFDFFFFFGGGGVIFTGGGWRCKYNAGTVLTGFYRILKAELCSRRKQPLQSEDFTKHTFLKYFDKNCTTSCVEHLLAITEGCNDFDIPHCYFNVSGAEISFNFVFFNEEGSKNWAQVNDVKNFNQKDISKEKEQEQHKLISYDIIFVQCC